MTTDRPGGIPAPGSQPSGFDRARPPAEPAPPPVPPAPAPISVRHTPGAPPADGLASALAAIESSRAAVNSTRAAVKDTREAVTRAREAIAQSVAELRRAAELAARESAGERLSRAESRALTRERLLDAAAEVFNRYGYHGASLEAVAEAAGFTKGAVYSNFATKGDLFIALNRRYAIRQMEQQATAMSSMSLEALAEQGGAMLVAQARSQESWDLLQIEFWLAAMRDPELRAATARDSDEMWADIGRRFEERFAADGLRPPFSGIEFAKLVSAIGSGLLLKLYLDPDYVGERVFSRAIRALLGLSDEAADEATASGAPSAGGDETAASGAEAS